MFKFLRIVSYYINRRKRDELRRLALGIFVLAVAFLLVPNIITPVHASEPSLAEIFEHLGFTVIAEWYVLSGFHGSLENSTQGRMGDVIGKPTREELLKIKEDTERLAKKYPVQA